MDRYLALQKTDMSVSITENEIYNTHSLLEKYLHVLSLNPSDRLREILKIVGSAPSQVPRELNNTINLPLRSKWEGKLMNTGEGFFLR